MNKWNSTIIIVFVGILGILGGMFVVEWSERQKPKRMTLTSSYKITPVSISDRVEPTYPAKALKDRIEGTVRLMVKVGNDGSATSTQIVKGVRQDIDSAATQAVRLWRFTPSGTTAIVSLDFKMQERKQTDR